MPISYSEISSSGISSDDFNTLFSSTQNIDKQILFYRQNPSFDTNIGTIGGRAGGLPFSTCADNTRIVRVFNNSGNYYSDSYIEGSGWSSAVLVSAGLNGIRPSVKVNPSGGYDVYLVKTTGFVYKFHSTNGTTWDAGTQFSVVGLDTIGNLEWIAYAGGASGIECVYHITKTAYGNRRLQAITPTSQFDTGVWWPFQLKGFDVEWIKVAPDDTSGDRINTDIRHVVCMCTPLPNVFTYKLVDGAPQLTAIPTGGLISFVVRPGSVSDARQADASTWYPISVSENTNGNSRLSCHVTACNSIFDASNNNDTVYVCAIGNNLDINTSDASYGFSALFYYSSRDGKNWSQDRIIPTEGLNGDLSTGAQLIKCGNYLYLVTGEALIKSPGCYEFNNPLPGETLDITHRVMDYSSQIADMRQTTLNVDNRDGELNNSILLQGYTLAMITKFGGRVNGGPQYLFTVATEEVDQIAPNRQRPTEVITIMARDRMSWMVDRSENQDAIQWDSQVSGRDTFTDIGGVENSGLAHSAVVQGTFETSNNTLIVKSGYKESIEFNTYKSNVADGVAASIFTVPNPENHTSGATSTNNPTYAGIVFRAFDKSNFWMIRFNYWSQKIELVERRNNSDLYWYSKAPSDYFLSRAITEYPIGLRVEFKNSRIRVWETTQISATGQIWSFSFEYIVNGNTDATPAQLTGYVGQIGCGFSDMDNAASTSVDENSDIGGGTVSDCSDCGFASFDGTSVIVYTYTNIALGTSIDTNPTYCSLPMAGLNGISLKQLQPDPFGDFWVNHSGVAPCYAISDGNNANGQEQGIYKIDDIFNCSLVWTKWYGGGTILNDGGSGPDATLRVSHHDPNVIYALWSSFSGRDGQRILTRVVNGSQDWQLVFTGQHTGINTAMDIDQYGTDEALIAYYDYVLQVFRIYRVLNGVASIIYSLPWNGCQVYCYFIQKPLLRFDGTPNTGTGSNETIIAGIHRQDSGFNIQYTEDGGAHWTTIPTSPLSSPAPYMSSMAAGDDPNTMIFAGRPNDIFCDPDLPGWSANGLWTTTNRGSSWSKVTNSSEANSGITCGFYPVKIGGNYRIYTGGTSDIGYMPSLTSPMQSIKGNYTTAVGSISSGGGIKGVIPL